MTTSEGEAQEQNEFYRREDFHKACMTDGTVNRILRVGGTLEEVIIRLVEEKKLAFQRIETLEQICPKKIKTEKGTYVWHCPDELVPFTP